MVVVGRGHTEFVNAGTNRSRVTGVDVAATTATVPAPAITATASATPNIRFFEKRKPRHVYLDFTR